MGRNRRVAAFIASILVVSVLGAYWLQQRSSAPPPATDTTHATAVYKVAIDQADAPSAETIYVIFTNESNSGSATWNVNSTSFEAVSNTSSTYSVISPPFSDTVNQTAVPAGGHRSMELFFQVPTSQKPVQLIYTDQSTRAKTVIVVPPVSSWVSKFNALSEVMKKGSGNYVTGIIVYAVVLNTTYGSFIGDHIWYRFFTGDRVTVGIEVQYFKQPPDPQSITISSVTNTDGFSVVSINPSMPVTMTGWGSKAEIQVTMLPPAKGYSGGVHFVVEFGSPTA